MRHVTQAEELLGQAGFSVEETISALPGLLNLASAGDLDLAAATDIASGTLKAFSLQASDAGHVADVLALSASATNSDVTDLGEAMKYCAPVSQSLGISLEDTAAAVGLLSNANIKGSQSGTVLRQTMARLASPTKEASKVMKKYGINAFDSTGNMKPLSGVVDNLNSSLSKLTSQQRADVISTIFGTESMSGVLALMNQGGKSVSDLSQQLKDANGAAQKMSDTKLDNLNGQWIKLKAAVEHMQITLGEKLAPYAKEFVTWLTGKMPALTDKVVEMVDYVSKHTQEIKSLATTVIGLAVAFKALSAISTIKSGLSGIASFVNLFKGAKVAEEAATAASGISKLGMLGKLLPAIFTPAGIAVVATVGLIGAAAIANNNLMKKSITTTTEELTPMQRVMNEFHGHLYKSKQEMVEAGLIYDDFGDGISDKFKKAAQDASKSLLKMGMDINRFTTDNKFDESENNQLKSWVNDMAYEGINAIKAKQSEIKSQLSKTFNLDGISTSEQGTLDYMDKFFDEGVNRELQIRDEMYNIGDTAIKDHGKLLDGDIKQLKEKAAELQSIKLEYANAENAKEQAYAKSKFKSKADRVTGIDGAAELLKDRATEHQKSIDEIKANYDGTIAATQYHLDNDKNLSDEDKTNLQTTINENKSARDKALQQAEANWKSDLETLYSTFPKARGMLNEDNGEKFTGNEIESNKRMENILSSHTGARNIVKSGVYSLMDDNTNRLDTLYVDVDETTQKIRGVINTSNGDIAAYSNAQKEKLSTVKDQYIEAGAAMQQLINSQASLRPGTNEVVNRLGDVGELTDVKTAADGAKTGILELNGTPVQITADASGAIKSIELVEQKRNELDGTSATVTIVSQMTESGALSGLGGGLSGYTPTYHEDTGTFYASGTDNAERGVATVGEQGYEVVLGRQKRWFDGGEKVLNHKESKAFLENQQNNEPFQVRQGQFQLLQPQQQVQVAGGGGNNIQVDVQVNGGNQDEEGLIAQVTQEVGRKLRDALADIKN